ncbi:MAG: 50S ribosomal protein L9 [Gemmatimonadales bacterium]|nr:MAG: 50S ribosomal protein L9 [Gemmatimonadales bacterium]
MKVILNKDIPNLGEEGDIKTVARGYARNFLIPKSLVMPYTREAIAILESRRERLDQRRVEKQKAAMDIKTRLETEDLVLEMPAGDRGRLFGSVTSATIVDALAAQGISIERRRLEIPEKTIKSIGTTRVRVRLYGDEEAELKVVVRAVGSTDGASARSEAAAVVPDVQADDAVADTEDTEAVASDVDDSVADETATEVEDTED